MDHIPPPQQMFQHITAYWVTQLMGTAARLGLADCLEAGPLLWSSCAPLSRILVVRGIDDGHGQARERCPD